MSGRVVVAGGVAVEEMVRRAWLTGEQGAWIGHRHDLRVGGVAALAAVAAGAVGAAARCVGAVGTDPAGTACRRHLARADVDVTTVSPVPGPTSRILRPFDWDLVGESMSRGGERGCGLGDLLLLPGAAWGIAQLRVGEALRGCQAGDVLLLDWSALEGSAPLVEAAYDRDLQIVALLAPYPVLPQGLDLGTVDVVVVDQRGAAWLADAGELPGSMCVLVGQQGLSWDGETVLAPALSVPTQPVDRAYAVLAGALAGRLACGDDRPEAAEVALRLRAAYELGRDDRGGMGPWPGLRLDVEELG